MTVEQRTPAQAVEAVWRLESAALVARLSRLVGDVGTAEDLAQDVLVIALEQWPNDGVPSNPAAWLMATARHRAVDLIRRRVSYAEKLMVLAGQRNDPGDPDVDDVLDDPIGDDLLRLVFTACDPTLSPESTVALVLRVLCGMRTDEIARALLVPTATVQQRIVRAKRTLTGVRFELPSPPELADRLASVLDVVYLVFNEGYSATAGPDWTRPDLCAEAMRLGRLLVSLASAESEVHALLALMELQASRLPARTDDRGNPVLLADQDRRRWDRLLIRRGSAGLDRAVALGGGLRPYALQAAIAACHAQAPSEQLTDWERVAALYTVLAAQVPSPVVALNRAVAVSFADGPEVALPLVDEIVADGRLARYPHLAAVRGDLLQRLGRPAEAAAEFDRAAEMTGNDRESSMFRARGRFVRSSAGAGAP